MLGQRIQLRLGVRFDPLGPAQTGLERYRPLAFRQAHALGKGQNLAQMTLPLALICIGGTLSLEALRKSGDLALSSSLVKMVGLPVLATLGAWLCGFRGAELGILFLYFGSPTAAASFVMARAANGNHELAAAIIVITTLMAAVTTNIGIFVLQWGGWI